MSEGGYEKKRKYQRKNSISSCAGYSSNHDFGSIDIDSSSGDFEVIASGMGGCVREWDGRVCVRVGWEGVCSSGMGRNGIERK
jgi:hypothetical protein